MVTVLTEHACCMPNLKFWPFTDPKNYVNNTKTCNINQNQISLMHHGLSQPQERDYRMSFDHITI